MTWSSAAMRSSAILAKYLKAALPAVRRYELWHGILRKSDSEQREFAIKHATASSIGNRLPQVQIAVQTENLRSSWRPSNNRHCGRLTCTDTCQCRPPRPSPSQTTTSRAAGQAQSMISPAETNCSGACSDLDATLSIDQAHL